MRNRMKPSNQNTAAVNTMAVHVVKPRLGT
jgi:hypothetical protein